MLSDSTTKHVQRVQNVASPIDRLIELQIIVEKEYTRAVQEHIESLNSTKFFMFHYPKTVLLVGHFFLLWQFYAYIFYLNPGALSRLGIPTTLVNWQQNIFFALCYWLIYLVFLELVPDGVSFVLTRSGRLKYNESFRFIYMAFLNPIIIASSLPIISSMLGVLRSTTVVEIIFLIGVLSVFIFMFAFIAIYLTTFLNNFIPKPLLSVLARPMMSTDNQYIFNHDMAIKRTLSSVDEYITQIGYLDLSNLLSISRSKSMALIAQVDSVAPVYSAISITSLVAIVFSQEQIVVLLENISSIVTKYTDPSFASLVYILPILLILILTAAGFQYFVSIHHSIRMLYIIELACEFRIAFVKDYNQQRQNELLLARLIDIADVTSRSTRA